MSAVPAEIKIRRLGESDVEEFYRVRLLGLEQHPQAFSEDADRFRASSLPKLHERMFKDRDNSFIIGALIQDRLIGTVGLYRSDGAKIQHRMNIWGVFVDAAYRRHRIGASLMQEAITQARQIPGVTQVALAVTSTSEAAISLYISLGFQVYGIDPRRLKIDGQFYDEHLMIYELS